MTRRSYWPTSLPGLALSCAIAIGCGTNEIEGVNPTGGGPVSGGPNGPVIVPGGDPFACDPATDAVNRGAGGRGGGMIFPGSATTPAFGGIVMATEPPPPISGGTLIVLRDGLTAVAADPDRDRIYVVDLTDLTKMTVRASIALTPRDQPGRLVQDGAGQVHVVLRGAGGLVTIDPVAGQVTMRRPVCALPRGLAYDQAGDRLHVACAGGELVTFTPGGATAVRTLKLRQDLRDVVVDGDKLMVSRFRSAELMVLDTNGVMAELIRPPVFKNAEVQAGSPFEAAVAWRTVGTPDGGAVMVHHRGKGDKVGRTRGGYGGFSPCDPIVHTGVTRMKSGEKPVAGPAMPGFVLPVDIALSGDGTRVAMVAAGNGHTEFGARRLFVANVDDVTAEGGRGCPMDDKHGPSSVPTCGVAGGTGGTTGTAGMCPAGLVFCNGTCFDAVMSPCGSGAGGASATGSTSGTGGASGAAGATGTTAPAGGRAAGGSSATPTCSVDLPGSVEPVSVAFAGPNLVVVQTRDPAQLWVVSEMDRVTNMVALSQESRADTGHAVFHSNSGGGLACASCHPEGNEDGRVWDFQCEGPRRTQDLAGGIGGTEPFHWGGDLSDFPALVHEVFVQRMSGPSLTQEQTVATLRWINSVPTKPGLRVSTDPQVQRGKALFESTAVGCATCHAGGALTNNTTVDVGTSARFQVPSLRGLAWRGPYMHDGCAPTLTARFGSKFCDGGDAHGKTSQLPPSQIDDLVAYLESL